MNSPHSDENGGRILVSFAKMDFHDDFKVEDEIIELEEGLKLYPTREDPTIKIGL
jgi:hypothetical protein